MGKDYCPMMKSTLRIIIVGFERRKNAGTARIELILISKSVIKMAGK